MRLKRKKHPITLLEIMIVILLIGLIGGVLSYNLKGTLERGKKFRTEEGIRRLKEILNLEIERGPYTIDQLTGSEAYENVKKVVENSGFINKKDVKDFLQDGWKEPYYYTKDSTYEIAIHSHHLDRYKTEHPDSQ